MKREPVIIEKRKAPTLKEQVEILKRQALCFMCREPLQTAKQVEYDHAKPLALGGKNEVSNLNALCPKCHRRKTDSDVAIIAKSKRQAGETGQYARRQRNGPKLKSGKRAIPQPTPEQRKAQYQRAKAMKARMEAERRDER